MLSLLISVAAASLLPGQSTTLTFALAGGSNVTGIQWDYSCVGLTVGTPVIGAAATAAGKTLGITTVGGILIYGLDTQAILPGVLATVTVTVPLNAPAGNAVISLSNVIASDALGTSLPITAGFPITLIILPASVASVVAPAATATAALRAPTVQAGANIQAVAAIATASFNPPTVSDGGGSLGPRANVFAVPAIANSAAIAPSIQAGANVLVAYATASAFMPAPVVSGGQSPVTPTHGKPGIFKGHGGGGHSKIFR